MLSGLVATIAMFLMGKAPGSGGTGALDKASLWGLSNYLGASETAPPPSLSPSGVVNAFPTDSTRTAQTAAPASLVTAFLERPQLLGPAKALRDATVKNMKDLSPPYTLESFLAAALSKAGGDTGTALLFCVNVARAFARGGYRIYWQRLGDWEKHFPALSIPAGFTRSDYTVNDTPDRVDPSLFYRIDPEPAHHAEGHRLTTERIDRSAGAPDGAMIKVNTMFWLLFDARDLNQLEDEHRDPGDHYHFYSIALAAFLGTKKRVTFDVAADIKPEAKLLLRQVFRDMQRFAGKTPREPSALMNADPALFGWTWANALSFVEEANFGEPDKQDETTRESNMHRRAATFGLEHAGMSVSRGWNWYVPVAQGLLSATGTGIGAFLLAGTDPPLEASQALLFCRLDPQTGEVIRE